MELSRSVACSEAPPARGTIRRVFPPLNRILSSLLHEPPTTLAASARARACPPARSITLSFPWDANASESLFGDQKGNVAPSVPGNGRASNFGPFVSSVASGLLRRHVRWSAEDHSLLR